MAELFIKIKSGLLGSGDRRFFNFAHSALWMGRLYRFFFLIGINDVDFYLYSGITVCIG